MELKEFFVLGLDLETTDNNVPRYIGNKLVSGLVNTQVIEVGYVLAKYTIDPDNGVSYEIVDEYSSLVDAGPLRRHMYPKVVNDMHEESGLFKRYEEMRNEPSFKSTDIVDEYISNRLKKVLKEHLPDYDEELVRQGQCNYLKVVGKNPQFDTSFMFTKFLRTSMLFHYQLIDVSFIKNIARVLREDWRSFTGLSNSKVTHRALDDVYAALNDYEVLLSYFKDHSDLPFIDGSLQDHLSDISDEEN